MALWLLSVNIGPSCVQWLFCWLNIFLETQRISYLLKGWGETCVWDKIRRAVRHHYSHIWMAKIQNRQHQMLARLWSNRNSRSLPMGMQSITLEDSLAVFLQNWTLSNQTIQQSTQCSLVFMSTQKPTQGCYSSFVHKCQKPGNNHTVLGEWTHQFGHIRQRHIIQMSTQTMKRHVKWKWKSLSRVRLFAAPWTIQFMEFSRPEYWSGSPFPSPGDLSNLGIEPWSPALQADSFPAEPQGKPKGTLNVYY